MNTRLDRPRLRLGWQPEWYAHQPASHHGPRIALIHGLMAGQHMQRHLLWQVREWGYADSSLFANHARAQTIADHLEAAAQQGRPIVLMGYSQGGFLAVKVARLLATRGVTVQLLVTIAAGGLGRIYPAQWGADPRTIPANVQRVLNIFSAADRLGGDLQWRANFARSAHAHTQIDNIGFAAQEAVDHLSIARCGPAERVHPAVKVRFLDRLALELAAL